MLLRSEGASTVACDQAWEYILVPCNVGLGCRLVRTRVHVNVSALEPGRFGVMHDSTSKYLSKYGFYMQHRNAQHALAANCIHLRRPKEKLSSKFPSDVKL